MATEIRGLCVGKYTASADLSGKQYCFARQSGTAGQLNVTSLATQKPIGVIQNKPTTGQPVDLMVTGVSKMVAGAAVAAGADVMSDANGNAITAVTNTGANFSLGQAQTAAAAAGTIIEVLLPGVAKSL
jgi:hypothetical protein